MNSKLLFKTHKKHNREHNTAVLNTGLGSPEESQLKSKIKFRTLCIKQALLIKVTQPLLFRFILILFNEHAALESCDLVNVNQHKHQKEKTSPCQKVQLDELKPPSCLIHSQLDVWRRLFCCLDLYGRPVEGSTSSHGAAVHAGRPSARGVILHSLCDSSRCRSRPACSHKLWQTLTQCVVQLNTDSPERASS